MPEDSSRVWAADMAAAYAEHLVPAVFQPYAADLAPRVLRHRPQQVLELAAGTGVLTRAMVASMPAAQITATDLNLAMVEVGRAQVPEAVWRQADAMRLPFADGSADVVVCQFGVMFFPDRPAAYAEVARVLRPEGRFLFSSWGPLSSHDVETAVITALAELFPDDPPTFLARVPHGYSDVELIRADLTCAGFGDARVETVALACAGRTGAQLARGYCLGSPLRGEIEARGDLQAATVAVTRALERQFGSGPVVGRMSALVVEARQDSR